MKIHPNERVRGRIQSQALHFLPPLFFPCLFFPCAVVAVAPTSESSPLTAAALWAAAFLDRRTCSGIHSSC